jgi:hypothetical protein
MTRRRTNLSWVRVACLAAAMAWPEARAAAPAATLAQQIDALLKHRLRPEPLPLELPNPFVVTGGGIRDVVTEGARARPAAAVEGGAARDLAANPDQEAVPPSHADVLAACAGRLKIGGIIRMKDQVQIVINDAPRKEGDFITMPWNGGAVHLRIVRLQPEQLTLRYQDAELTLRY